MIKSVKKLRALQGKVISSKMDKTISVLVERKEKHPIYGKIIKKSTKYHVHDAKNICCDGDTVSITETRPYSKMKKWCLISIINKAK